LNAFSRPFKEEIYVKSYSTMAHNFHKMQRLSCTAEDQLASEELLCWVESGLRSNYNHFHIRSL